LVFGAGMNFMFCLGLLVVRSELLAWWNESCRVSSLIMVRVLLVVSLMWPAFLDSLVVTGLGVVIEWVGYLVG